MVHCIVWWFNAIFVGLGYVDRLSKIKNYVIWKLVINTVKQTRLFQAASFRKILVPLSRVVYRNIVIFLTFWYCAKTN